MGVPLPCRNFQNTKCFFFTIDVDTDVESWQTAAIIRKRAIFSHFVMGSTVIAVILIN